MNKEIAGKLLALRKQNGFSQEELAEKLGVSRQAVSKWERGEASPDTENLIALAKIYNISLDRLFDLDTDAASQRSSINLEKKREESEKTTDEGGMRIKYPENSAQRELYPENEQKTASFSAEQKVQYKEAEDNYGTYFKYETVDDRSDENNSYSSRTNFSENKLAVIADKIRNDEKFYKKLIKFPYPIATAAAFFVTGALFEWWHPMWMLFLTIPLYYTTIEAVRNKNANIFCYPVLTALLFLILGFAVDFWHPAWLIFLTIPLYYWYINRDKDEPEKNN